MAALSTQLFFGGLGMNGSTSSRRADCEEISRSYNPTGFCEDQSFFRGTCGWAGLTLELRSRVWGRGHKSVQALGSFPDSAHCTWQGCHWDDAKGPWESDRLLSV